ncbi:para-nitrobenzyl esterase-like [Ornithodoros turicata]|uniref:para-nitrobenzyl esterase-like n=1 Tax=Ornithodoros turicata TaxID=34597 RepID=UPI003139F7CC
MSLLRGIHRPYSHLSDEDDLLRYPTSSTSPAEGRTFISNTTSRMTRPAVLVPCAVALMVVVALAVTAAADPFGALGSNETTDTPTSSSSNRLEDVVKAKTTSCGEVVGVVEDGAFAFKGLRYAEPPVGEHRWRRPRPLASTQNTPALSCVTKADQFGSQCLQINPNTKKFEGSEDCLFVNVWTPRIDATAHLEVMVWIHGGFLQVGSGHQPGLSPSGKLAHKLNVVMVSFNYRLGPLGFMALSILRDDNDTRGNFGLLDAALALDWVRNNIQAFGGDPDKVTVFGADSGATMTLALLATSRHNKTKSPFRSAWLLGPTFFLNRTFALASKHNGAFFQQRTGCKVAACLRAMTPHDVLKAHLGKDDPSFRIRDQNDLPIQGIFPEQFMVVDGTLLTNPPLEMLLKSHSVDIPVLIGSGAQAVDVLPGPDDIRHWTWGQYKKYVTTSLNSFGSGVTQMALQLYNSTSNVNTSSADPPVTPELVYTTMVSDLRVGCPVNSIASELSNIFQSPVYRYVVDSKPSKPIDYMGHAAAYSFHPWDAIAFFDQLDHFIPGPSYEDFAFRDNVQDLGLTFVRSGGHPSIPDWMRYPQSIAILASSANSTLIMPGSTYQKTECKFWTSEGLTDYSWVS